MNIFQKMADIFAKYHQMIFKGIGYTMLVSIIGTIIGLVIGLLIGVFRTMPTPKNKFLRVLKKAADWILSAYVEIFRGTPMMVQAMVIFWGYAFANGGKTLPVIPAGIFIVSINTGAYMAEIVRGGIISVDRGQFEAAYAIGMNHWNAMLHVVIPQVLRNILPSVSNEFVINIKDTSVLNVIGVTELYYIAGVIYRANFKMFQDYAIVCVIYFILTFTVTRLLRLLEKKLAGGKSYTICGSQSDSAAEIHITEEGT